MVGFGDALADWRGAVVNEEEYRALFKECQDKFWYFFWFAAKCLRERWLAAIFVGKRQESGEDNAETQSTLRGAEKAGCFAMGEI